MNKQQPKALRLADTFEHPLPPEWSDMQDAAAELRRLHIEVGQYKAARIGYASEFPVNAEGLPDVENIHRNIRNMKFMRDELLQALIKVQEHIRFNQDLNAADAIICAGIAKATQS